MNSLHSSLHGIKQKDLLLLACLRENARKTLTEISRQTKIPISTIFDRLKTTRESIIKKHTTIIDFAMLGFNTTAKIVFKTQKDKREELKNFLLKHQNINSIYKINNGYDFLVEGIFRNIKELEDFSEMLEEKFKIRSKQVYYVIEEIAREQFFSKPEHLEILTAQ